MAEIEINLSQRSIKEAIRKLQSFKESSESLGDKILNDIAEEGLDEINSSLSNSNFEFSEKVTAFSRIENGKAEIGIQGNQAIYEEYGTGTVGEMNPHPEKPDYLDDYNYNTIANGGTIRENKSIKSNATSQGIPVGGLYWTYKFNGEKIYTQGRPAGAHVYKASQRIKKNAKKIIAKRLGEELSKL